MSAATIAPFGNAFAHTIYSARYQHPQDHNWRGTAERVVEHPLGALEALGVDLTAEKQRLVDRVATREFVPGGRYLYAAGRDLHQVNNCVLLRCPDDREGWATTSYQAEMALMTGAGIGVWYGDVRPGGSPIKRTGGVASGPLPKMQQVNETGRHTMQGGNRRSAIWAGLPWWHADIFDFIVIKDWSEEVKALKQKDWTFPAPCDMTNISVTLDDEFFAFYEDVSRGLSHIGRVAPEWYQQHGERAPDGGSWDAWAHRVYDTAVQHMVAHGEPGFSVDIGDKSGEVLRNAPVGAATRVLTPTGFVEVGEIVEVPTTVWTGKQWAPDVKFKPTALNTDTVVVTATGGRKITCDPTHEFVVERYVGAGTRRRLDRIEHVPASQLRPGDVLSVSLPETLSETVHDAPAYTLGYAYGDGSFTSSGLDITFCTAASKACIHRLIEPRAGLASDSRGFSRYYYDWDTAGLNKERLRYSGTANEIASLIAGLFDADGNISADGRPRLSNKASEFLCDVRALLESIGILAHVSKNGHSTYGGTQTYQLVVAADSQDDFAALIPCQRVVADRRTTAPYRDSLVKVLAVAPGEKQDVFCADVKVEEHTFAAEGVLVRNCTEITSADDSDVCNLGSIVLPRIGSPVEFGAAVRDAVLFLTAGSVYSDIPYEKVGVIRDKNRRLGLGLIGVHEFLMLKGVRYGTDDAFEVLEPYMLEYRRALEYAHEWQDALGLSLSKGATAIAPNGTIGIVAESTPSGDPLFAAAESRQVKIAGHDGDSFEQHIVVDPTAKRLMDAGVPTYLIEDAHTLSLEPERRLSQQAFLQDYTDHAISSTVNLPHVVTDKSEAAAFGKTLMRYLPRLRGITAYPDGARDGQPRTPVDLDWAVQNEGVIFEGTEDTCSGGVCGI